MFGNRCCLELGTHKIYRINRRVAAKRIFVDIISGCIFFVDSENQKWWRGKNRTTKNGEKQDVFCFPGPLCDWTILKYKIPVSPRDDTWDWSQQTDPLHGKNNKKPHPPFSDVLKWVNIVLCTGAALTNIFEGSCRIEQSCITIFRNWSRNGDRSSGRGAPCTARLCSIWELTL